MIEELLDLLRPSWPVEWTSDPAVGNILDGLVDDLRQGYPSSLPVVQTTNRTIGWLSMGKSAAELRDYLADAKGWLTGADGAAISNRISHPAASSPLAPMLHALSPQGYARWNTTLERGEPVLLRLGKMRDFLASRPEASNARVASLPALRLEFISALSVGDWERAQACIGEIDYWNLAHATVTLQMRIRLYDARGDINELFNYAVKHRAWNIGNPKRIAAAIISAVDECEIQPMEASMGLANAYSLFRQKWFPLLVHCISEARGEYRSVRLQAFAAAADNDHESLRDLVPSLPSALATFLQAQLHGSEREEAPGVASAAAVPAAPTDGLATTYNMTGEYWTRLYEAVAQVRPTEMRNLIASLDSNHFDDPDFIARAPDAVFELLTDPAIEEHSAARVLQYEVLAALIDALVMAPNFPRVSHLEIYLALLDGLVALRGGVASDADSQLVLGLVGAAANLDVAACARCIQIVCAWWMRRPIVQRLDWLAGALDTLALLCSDATPLVGLYADGLGLAERKGIVFTRAEAGIWHDIGKALELTPTDINKYLHPLLPADAGSAEDLLSQLDLRQIAIVSLREASAQDAAAQLQERTGAKVSVVSSLVAGPETRHALSADLILYVWAATSHATYRAFDGSRDKLEYVQGTGASSIVLAAERWAARQNQYQ